MIFLVIKHQGFEISTVTVWDLTIIQTCRVKCKLLPWDDNKTKYKAASSFCRTSSVLRLRARDVRRHLATASSPNPALEGRQPQRMLSKRNKPSECLSNPVAHTKLLTNWTCWRSHCASVIWFLSFTLQMIWQLKSLLCSLSATMDL